MNKEQLSADCNKSQQRPGHPNHWILKRATMPTVLHEPEVRVCQRETPIQGAARAHMTTLQDIDASRLPQMNDQWTSRSESSFKHKPRLDAACLQSSGLLRKTMAPRTCRRQSLQRCTRTCRRQSLQTCTRQCTSLRQATTRPR